MKPHEGKESKNRQKKKIFERIVLKVTQRKKMR